MSKEAVELSFNQKIKELGRGALNAIYSNDVEFYLLALELVNSNGDVVDYFAWPVLPKEIRETQQEITNVRKTIGGVYVLKNTTFTPSTINISGTFGRRFKLLVNNTRVELAGFRLSLNNGVPKITPPNLLQQRIPEFSSIAKTGYGCIKILESMKEKSKQLDENGKPHSLYFYNPILGNNYQVEVINFTHTQNENENNMLPAYSLQLVAVAPLDSILSRLSNIKSAIKNLSFSSLQKTANSIVSNLKSVSKLKKLIRR